MKTKTRDGLLLQRALGRSRDTTRSDVGLVIWGHGVALTLTGHGDLHGWPGRDQDTEESSSCSSWARQDLGAFSLPPAVVLPQAPPADAEPQICQKSPPWQ